MVGCNGGRYEGDLTLSSCVLLSVDHAQRYFPEQMVSKAYLTECDSLTEMAAMMIHSMRQILEDRFNFR